MCLCAVCVNSGRSLLTWASLHNSNILIQANQWAFPCNWGPFHIHYINSAAPLNKEWKTTKFLYQATLQQLQVFCNPAQRERSVWSVQSSHTMEKWPTKTHQFLSREDFQESQQHHTILNVRKQVFHFKRWDTLCRQRRVFKLNVRIEEGQIKMKQGFMEKGMNS